MEDKVSNCSAVNALTESHGTAADHTCGVKVTIDPEFAVLCPATSAEEDRLLGESIVAEKGAREPIIVWNTDGNPIVDGHRRYGICTKHKLPYTTSSMNFTSRSHVRAWMLQNQLGRRNLSDVQRSILRGKFYNEIKGEQGGDHRNRAVRSTGDGSKVQDAPLIDAAAAIASKDGVSRATVKRDAKLADAVKVLGEKAPELVKAVERGQIPTGKVANLADMPKDALTKLEGTDLRKAVAAVINDEVFPDDKSTGTAESMPVKTPVPIAAIMKALKSGKMKATPEHVAKLASFDEDIQGDLLDDIVGNRQTLVQALETGCKADLTVAEEMEAVNKSIESFCRGLMAYAEANLPNDPWLTYMGRSDSAMQKIKDACSALRTCKCVGECPKCVGDGCPRCLNTGRVTRYVKDQLG
jgi:hypothetical protein